MDRYSKLEQRIEVLGERDSALGESLHSVLAAIPLEPRKAIFECRFILDDIVARLINDQYPEKNVTLHDYVQSLSHPMFISDIPPLVLPRIIFVWSMIKTMTSSDTVRKSNAWSVLENLIHVAEWFTLESGIEGIWIENGKVVEILPQLKAQYKEHLRPDIVSVRFRQSETSCYVQILIEDNLGYIAGRENKGLRPTERMFKPQRSIYENVHAFINDFDERDIIECIPLFSESAIRNIVGGTADDVPEQVFENDL